MSASYLTIGGFLGAGKTTAMLRLAQLLVGRGLRVGLITNDQSRGLVDTGLAAAGGFPVREITDGCFCCRFDSLVEAARDLERDARPDVFLAEPVGSCTDLRATVQLPLARLYGDAYRVAPLSVVIDPLRAARAFDLDPGPSFSERVLYIYDKQLEEADLLVLNKIDIVGDELRAQLEATLARRYPRSEVLSVSARTGAGVEAWLDRLLAAEPVTRRPDIAVDYDLDVDYDLYAEGEALLGWVNATLSVTSARAFDANEVLASLADALRVRLDAAAVEVAHLKMSLASEDGAERATIQLVRSASAPEPSRRAAAPVRSGELIVNLRAESDPERLHALMLDAIAAVSRDAELDTTIRQEAHFRPGRPVPTHRMVSARGVP